MLVVAIGVFFITAALLYLVVSHGSANGGCAVNRFALGEYFPANESWVTEVQTATIDSGPNSNWEYAGFVGAVKTDKDKRFMNIGCAFILSRTHSLCLYQQLLVASQSSASQ